MKTLDNYFADWEAHVFGYGYGSGEGHVIPALKRFLALCHSDGYDYRELEGELGGAVTWLLINALCHAGVLEYGTSPRFAWLTEEGHALKAYLVPKPMMEIEDAVEGYDGYCYPDHCNCDGEECHNPFWQEIKPRGRNT